MGLVLQTGSRNNRLETVLIFHIRDVHLLVELKRKESDLEMKNYIELMLKTITLFVENCYVNCKQS